MNDWEIVRAHDTLKELADRWGFYTESDYRSKVLLRAKPGSGVWADDVLIAEFDSFKSGCAYMSGYAQAKLHSKVESGK